MQRVGFEPTKALSHRILSPAPLTTREPLQIVSIINSDNNQGYKNLYKPKLSPIFRDDHNSLATPDPVPISEVKQSMLFVLVSEMKQSL